MEDISGGNPRFLGEFVEVGAVRELKDNCLELLGFAISMGLNID